VNDQKSKYSSLVMNSKREEAVLTRRRFMEGAGATGLALLGGAPLSRAASSDPVVEFIQTSCGEENNEGPRILVGYASCCGSTGGIADAIGRHLCKAGARVDVKLIKEVDDPVGYDAFVLGSAIQAGRWLPESSAFLRRNKEVLQQVPVAYFIACLAMSEDTPRNRKIAENYVKYPLRKLPRVEPVGMGTFAGAVDYEKMPKKYRGIMKRIGAVDGDYRRWDVIRAWTESIAPKLMNK